MTAGVVSVRHVVAGLEARAAQAEVVGGRVAAAAAQRRAGVRRGSGPGLPLAGPVRSGSSDAVRAAGRSAPRRLLAPHGDVREPRDVIGVGNDAVALPVAAARLSARLLFPRAAAVVLRRKAGVARAVLGTALGVAGRTWNGLLLLLETGFVEPVPVLIYAAKSKRLTSTLQVTVFPGVAVVEILVQHRRFPWRRFPAARFGNRSGTGNDAVGFTPVPG